MYKTINFITPDYCPKNKKAYDLLVHIATIGFNYEQARDQMIESFHVYIPEDQYRAFEQIINIQINLNIGSRRAERNNSKDKK